MARCHDKFKKIVAGDRVPDGENRSFPELPLGASILAPTALVMFPASQFQNIGNPDSEKNGE